LPKPEDWFPGVTVEIYEPDGVTVTTTVQRGMPHKVRLRAFKYFTYNGTTYCKPWTDIPAGLNAYIALRTYGGGDFPVVAGDEFLIANTCPVLWDANGEVFIDGVVNGGTWPENNVNVEAYISYPGAPTNIMWGARGPIKIVPGTLADMVVAPIAPATTTFNVTVGGASQTQHWGVANTVVGTYLQWVLTQINVDAALVGKITTTPSQYVGMGVAGGYLDDVAVTVVPTTGPGTYAATLHFSAMIGNGTVLTHDEVLSVVVADDPIAPTFPGVPPLLTTYTTTIDGFGPVVVTYAGFSGTSYYWGGGSGLDYASLHYYPVGPQWRIYSGRYAHGHAVKDTGTTPLGRYLHTYGSEPDATVT
jgi:hypothetical protein